MNDTEKRKILNLAKPLITTYTQHAHLLSILGLNTLTYPWICSNYLQIFANKDLIKHSWADFYFPFPHELRSTDTCNWITTQKIQRGTILDKWEQLTDAIIYFIDNNTYVHVMVDMYCIPDTKAFNKHHILHDIFIFGYDCNKNIIYGADFIDAGKYGNFEVPFENINKGFLDYEKCTDFDYLYKNMYLYRLKSKDEYKFNITNVINSVKAYLDGTVPEYWHIYSTEYNDVKVYGINTYRAFIDYAANCALCNREIEHRFFYLLLDHKRMMTWRFKYLSEIGYDYSVFIAQLKEIEDQSKVTLNLVLKYNIQNDVTLIERIKKNLAEIEQKEQKVLADIIKNT